jgi:hypothetical protein
MSNIWDTINQTQREESQHQEAQAKEPEASHTLIAISFVIHKLAKLIFK